jgi:hypothetical protein
MSSGVLLGAFVSVILTCLHSSATTPCPAHYTRTHTRTHTHTHTHAQTRTWVCVVPQWQSARLLYTSGWNISRVLPCGPGFEPLVGRFCLLLFCCAPFGFWAGWLVDDRLLYTSGWNISRVLPCNPGFEPLVGRFCLLLFVVLHLAFGLVGWEMIGCSAGCFCLGNLDLFALLCYYSLPRTLYSHTHAHTHAHTRTHAHTHTHTHVHTHIYF